VIIRDIVWLWAASATMFKVNGFVAATRRMRFIFRALTIYESVKPFVDASPESPLGRLMEHRPETIGAVVWPYQCLEWDARTRLARIRDHCSVIERMGGSIDFPVEGQLNLLDLSEIRAGLRVIVDQPKWFMREGQLAINLFMDDTRLYSLVFSLSNELSGITAFVGGIQGRDIEGVLDQYRELTKASHGMRPRDLLIEVFKMLCATLGVTQIFAVSDESRHHRSPYFGKASARKLSVNYNDIWADRGGVRVNPEYYRLEVESRERNLDSVAAKKRGMYRRRYEMLRSLRQQINGSYRGIVDRESRNSRSGFTRTQSAGA
jgi:uncharacterized protein VirK/YbjX